MSLFDNEDFLAQLVSFKMSDYFTMHEYTVQCVKIRVGKWTSENTLSLAKIELPCPSICFEFSQNNLHIVVRDVKNNRDKTGTIPLKKIAYMQQGPHDETELIVQLKHAPKFQAKQMGSNFDQQCLPPHKSFRKNYTYLITLQSAAGFEKVKTQKLLSFGNMFNNKPPAITITEATGKKSLLKTLPYTVFFQCNVLLSFGLMQEQNMEDVLFIKELASMSPRDAEHYLHSIFFEGTPVYSPRKHLQEWKKKNIKAPPPPVLNETLAFIHKVVITPCSMYYEGPFPELTHRVLRYAKKKYNIHENEFLRVQFSNENKDFFGGSMDDDLIEFIDAILKDGITIQTKLFKFLGFSSSQLKDKSCWFYCEANGISGERLLNEMGTIKERCIARYSARLGQNFSTTYDSLEALNVLEIPDIKTKSGEYVFSDGVGRMSQQFAEELVPKVGYPFAALQIRFGGAKGVVSVSPDPNMKEQLHLRDSMIKFQSDHNVLEIVRASHFSPINLNRQIILLLSHLGVPDSEFLRLQKDYTNKVEAAMSNKLALVELIRPFVAKGTKNYLNFLYDLVVNNIPLTDPFVSGMIRAIQAACVRNLQTKARIPVPNGANLIGIMDELGILEDGEVYIYTRGEVRTGKVVVTRCPCLHPGDIRVLNAVDPKRKEFDHLKEVVVFPQKGKRPHASQMSGGDLDGDLFFVTWDTSLFPKIENVEPLSFKKEKEVKKDTPVTMSDVKKFFVDYMRNDVLGRIANAWVAFADKDMTDPVCLELAQVHSRAVDFAKTGLIAKMEKHFKVNEYPHYMEKPKKLKSVHSTSILGQLYDKVTFYDTKAEYATLKKYVTGAAGCKVEVLKCFDISDTKYVKETLSLYMEYCSDLSKLMRQFKLKCEAQVLTGFCLKYIGNQHDEQEAIRDGAKAVLDKFRNYFERMPTEDRNLVACTWYQVAYSSTYQVQRKKQLWSFAWVVTPELLKIKKEYEQANK